MSYIDGFVMAVPTANKEKFIEHARRSDTLFTEFGATRVIECWADDVPEGKVTDFGKAVQATAEESVVIFLDRMAGQGNPGCSNAEDDV